MSLFSGIIELQRSVGRCQGALIATCVRAALEREGKVLRINLKDKVRVVRIVRILLCYVVGRELKAEL